MRWFCSLLAALCLASPAAAAWHRAESDHFVIYADDSAKNVKRFAEVLESYHSALEVITGRKPGKPSPSNRLTIYAVGSASDVQALVGTKSRTLQGIYFPRAGASVAFVQTLRSVGKEPDEAMGTLLHEYAHHFLMSSNRLAMPNWMSEGAAEFYSAAAFHPDGRIDLGLPNFSRQYELAYATEVPIRHLLDEELYRAKASKYYDAFYGRSWLLYHYLTFEPERAGQLSAYWMETARGTPRIEAAEKAFGDLSALDRSLDHYFKSRRWRIVSAMPEQISVGPVGVTPLSMGHAEMLRVIMKLKRGVDEEEAKTLLPQVRTIADKHPGDVAVIAALAETELSAGAYPAAVASADRALAIDPNSRDALVQKGLAMFRIAEDADDRRAGFAAAMEPFTKLRGLESDHPYPLIYSYRSYVMRGAVPPQDARSALVRASILAPFDMVLAHEVGRLLSSEGSHKAAIGVLQPVAANPHGGGLAAEAKRLITLLTDKPDGVRVSLGTPIDSSEEEIDEDPAD